MEESNAPIEVACPVKSGQEGIESHGIRDGEFSMPICFLVKEHAKSLVSIQDLQNRVEILENVQEIIIDSLGDIKKFICEDSKTFSGLNLETSSGQKHALSLSKSSSFSKLSKHSYLSSSDHAAKSFVIKNKETALDSDKQDSGLDSDCREVHDRLSLQKPSNWVKAESHDELMQLLDEITERSEVLQKHIAEIENTSMNGKPDAKSEPLNNAVSSTIFAGSHDFAEDASKVHVGGQFEDKPLLNCRLLGQKRVTNRIDSNMVSSILKETNAVDLQRQVLIFLVENAVLQTKLNEMEQLLSFKNTESEKIENGLKDETRLLMMENRELRIALDEHKLETNSLRSKVMMLERVLQSVSSENQELTRHLGESLGLQNLARKDCKFSASYTFGSSNSSKLRRSSLPPQFSKSDGTATGVKSKLLSNTSNVLDVTSEAPEYYLPVVHTPATAYEGHGVPVQSSTPVPLTKLKDIKSGTVSPSSFQSIKKRLKNEKESPSLKSHKFKKCLEDSSHEDLPEAYAKNLKFTSTNLDSQAAKFPFSAILEKMKANAEYRLSKRNSLVQVSEASSSNLHQTAADKAKFSSSAGSDCFKPVTSQCHLDSRKGRDIHQRIQNILDKIVNESEEAT